LKALETALHLVAFLGEHASILLKLPALGDIEAKKRKPECCVYMESISTLIAGKRRIFLVFREPWQISCSAIFGQQVAKIKSFFDKDLKLV